MKIPITILNSSLFLVEDIARLVDSDLQIKLVTL